MGSATSVLFVPPLTVDAVRGSAVDVGFSTKVAGETFDAGVTYSHGEYIATDPHLPGARAQGDSVEAAEDNLANRIDVLV